MEEESIRRKLHNTIQVLVCTFCPDFLFLIGLGVGTQGQHSCLLQGQTIVR